MSWAEHRSIREVMVFLQGKGISTLFATKIYKTYGDQGIQIVSENPYRLAHDIYGIGFLSADKFVLAMGFERQREPRIEAGIKHALATRIKEMISAAFPIDPERIQNWASKYCQTHFIRLSGEQSLAVRNIPKNSFSILTGGPSCGKTTCTKVLVQLLKAMKKRHDGDFKFK